MFALSLPGLVCLLVALAAVERFGGWTARRLLPWRRRRTTPVSAVGLDEMTALFYATKHHELQQRRTELMLREEDGDGDRRPFRLEFADGPRSGPAGE
jgi:hypothetical protein